MLRSLLLGLEVSGMSRLFCDYLSTGVGDVKKKGGGYVGMFGTAMKIRIKSLGKSSHQGCVQEVAVVAGMD